MPKPPPPEPSPTPPSPTPTNGTTPEEHGANGTAAGDTAGIIAAAASGKTVYFQPRTYLLTGDNRASNATVYVSTDNQRWIGVKGKTKLQCTVATPYDPVQFRGDGFHVSGIWFDGNGKLAGPSAIIPNLHPPLYVHDAMNIIIEQCKFTGYSSVGVMINATNKYLIRDNWVDRGSAAPTAVENFGIVAAGGSDYGSIDNNDVLYGDISVYAKYLSIINNRIRHWTFSGGINTQAHPDNHHLLIANNTCYESGAAPDLNGYFIAGIENWAQQTVISGNICNNCCGAGIDNGGRQCTVVGNICYDNGKGPSGDTWVPGIQTCWQDDIYNAGGSMYSGNLCYGQKYGYSENANRAFRDIVLGANNFRGITAPVLLSAAGNTKNNDHYLTG